MRQYQFRERALSALFRLGTGVGIALVLLTSFAYHSFSQAPVKFDSMSPVDAPWPPFVRMIPLANSNDVTVSTGNVAQIYTQLQADFGSTSHTWSHTKMDYDPQQAVYQGVAEDALDEICPEPAGCLRIYEAGMAAQYREGQRVTIPYQFTRVQAGNAPDLMLNFARIRFGSTPFADEIPHTVILQVPPVLPAPLPPSGWLLPGGLYLLESDGMSGDLQASLSVQYDPDLIDWYGIDETKLELWAWNAANRQWHPLDSFVNTHANHVSAPIQDLTAYALVAPQNNVLWLPMVYP